MPSLRTSLFLLLLAWAVPALAQTVKVLVQSSPLAGFQYYAGKVRWDEMKVGDGLTLIREPDNPHDGKGKSLATCPGRKTAPWRRNWTGAAGSKPV